MVVMTRPDGDANGFEHDDGSRNRDRTIGDLFRLEKRTIASE